MGLKQLKVVPRLFVSSVLIGIVYVEDQITFAESEDVIHRFQTYMDWAVYVMNLRISSQFLETIFK